MVEYIEIGQLWKCETCYHNDQYGCVFGLGCDHGENYRPAYGKLKKADVAPVVHGRWLEQHFGTLIPIEYDDNENVIVHDCINYQCSLCGRTESKKEPYCNCGAKMDGE